MKTRINLAPLLLATAIGWLALSAALAQETAPTQEQSAGEEIPDEFQQLIEASKQVEPEAATPALVESIERAPEPVVAQQATSDESSMNRGGASSVQVLQTATTVEEPNAVQQAETPKPAMWLSATLFVVLAVAVVVGGRFALRSTHKIGWDAVVFIPCFAVVNSIPAVGALYIQLLLTTISVNSSLFSLLQAVLVALFGLYVIWASAVSSVWFRNRILEWYSNTTWMTFGKSAVDILGTNISRRFGIELLACALSCAVGWCGGVLLGLRELRRGMEPEETVGEQVGVVA